MDLVGMASASKISTRGYWKSTAILFLISFVIFLVTDLVLEHWTHVLGTNSVRGSFWYSLFMGLWFAFLFPPFMRALSKLRLRRSKGSG